MLEAKNQIGTFILIFITIIIGITLISALGDVIHEAVNPFTESNNSIDHSAFINSSGQMIHKSEIELARDDIISLSFSRTGNATPITEGTDWDWKDQDKGEIYLYDTDLFNITKDVSNFTEWGYIWGTKYVQGNAVSRTILNNLIMIFIVFGLVIWVFAMVNKQWLDKIS